MGANCEYLASRSGIFKLLTIVKIFGGVTVALGSYAHFESFYIWKVKEEVFIGITACCFTISLFYFLAHLSSDTLPLKKANRTIDFLYHVIAAVLLFIVGGIVIESTVEIDRKICRHFPYWPYAVPCQLYEEKLTASVIAVINGLLYGISAILIVAT